MVLDIDHATRLALRRSLIPLGDELSMNISNEENDAGK